MTPPGDKALGGKRALRISVIVPALNEAGRIGDCIRSARISGADEVVVVDGDSADETVAMARKAGADPVIAGPRGRAAQMNAGAASASGEILCFLHADTRMPAGGCEGVRIAMRDGATVGGAFGVTLEHSPAATIWTRALLGLTESMIGVRSRLFRRYTGDQAIFVRRSLFDRVGGYEEVPLMEDVRLSAAMRKAGSTVLLAQRAALR